MSYEKPVQNNVFVKLTEFGCIGFRNNVGLLHDKRSDQWVRFGLLNGSGDVIAIQPIVITQEMVGRTIGQFVSIECKKQGWKPAKNPGKTEKDQNDWIDLVRRYGGKAGRVQYEEDLIKLLE